MEQINNQEEYELIRERIKTRPINRKKLFRRTVITAMMAVIFGVLACITFLVLEPVFSNMLTPEEEPVANEIVIPVEEEEINPKDLLWQEAEPSTTQIIIQDNGRTSVDVQDYIGLYDKIYDVVKTSQKSIVSVSALKSDVDWFNNNYENENITTGLIVANNGIELLILAENTLLNNSDTIEVTFYNDLVVEGTIKETDKNTGLAIIAVPVSELSVSLQDAKIIATLGSSKSNRLIASPVIALGRPLGNVESVEYGMITSKGNTINLVDSNVEVFTTDMRGNSASNGIIYNMAGYVVGIIYHDSRFGSDTLSAIGISDIKKTIERMSNAKAKAYLGIIGTDVTVDAISNGVPAGAYVLGIDMESPAMRAGIQSGDVIVKINGIDITTYAVYSETLSNHLPSDEIAVTVKRLSGDEYREIPVMVELGDYR